MSETAEAVVQEYYEALRQGDPLSPFFLVDESTVKFGISEALFGFEAVSEALQTQTETTDSWTIVSTSLVVEERSEYATFADEVTMAWTDTSSGERRRFETRWSGTLVRRDAVPTTDGRDSENAGTPEPTLEAADRPAWAFQSMHVSAPHDL